MITVFSFSSISCKFNNGFSFLSSIFYTFHILFLFLRWCLSLYYQLDSQDYSLYVHSIVHLVMICITQVHNSFLWNAVLLCPRYFLLNASYVKLHLCVFNVIYLHLCFYNFLHSLFSFVFINILNLILNINSFYHFIYVR